MTSPNDKLPSPPKAGTRLHWLVAAGAVCVMIANSIALSILSIFTPFVTGDLGFATGPFQLYYSLLAVATMVTMPIAGRMMGTLGARKLLLIGGTVSALGLLGMSVAVQIWHFYLAGIVLGLGVGLGCMFVPVVLVNTWFQAKKGLVMGVVLAGTGIGGAVLSQIVPRIIGVDGSGWRPAFIFVAIVMAVFTIVPALVLVRNRPADHGLLPYGATAAPASDRVSPAGDTAPGLSFRQAMRSPWFQLFYAMLVLLGVILAIVQGMSVHLRLIGLTEQIGTLMTVLTLGLVFWKIALGALIDAIGLRWSMMITLGMCATACFFTPGTTSLALLIVMMLGTANGTVMPPMAGAVTFGQREFAAIWGIGATAFSLGNALGTPLWGAVKDATGNYDLAFRLMPVLIAICITGLLLALNRGQASYSQPS